MMTCSEAAVRLVDGNPTFPERDMDCHHQGHVNSEAVGRIHFAVLGECQQTRVTRPGGFGEPSTVAGLHCTALTRLYEEWSSEIDEAFLPVFLGSVGSCCVIDASAARRPTLSRGTRHQHNHRAYRGLLLVLAQGALTRRPAITSAGGSPSAQQVRGRKAAFGERTPLRSGLGRHFPKNGHFRTAAS